MTSTKTPRTVTHTQISAWLTTKGWTADKKHDREIWTAPSPLNMTVMVPTRTDYADYHRRLDEAVAALSHEYACCPTSMAETIAAHPIPSGYPNADKVSERRADLNTIGSFIEWATSNGYLIQKIHDDNGERYPVPLGEEGIRRALAAYIDIDYDAYRAEQEDMYQAVAAHAAARNNSTGDDQQ